MGDLRQQLIDDNGLACRCDPAWTDRKLHSPDCVAWIPDAVMETFTDWLRSEFGVWDEVGVVLDHLARGGL